MITIPVQIESIKTRKDNTVNINIGTQELSRSNVAELFGMLNKLGFMSFKDVDFTKEELEATSSLEPELDNFGKSKSQRLRNVLFITWKEDKEGFEEFKNYYDFKMEKFIEHVKSKIKG